MTNLVFVYGTLQPGERNAHLMETARLVGKGITANATFAMWEYPSATSPSKTTPTVFTKGADRIRGHVFEVDSRTLALLDKLERVGVRYDRSEVILAGGEVAYIYTGRNRLERPIHPSPRIYRDGLEVWWSESGAI